MLGIQLILQDLGSRVGRLLGQGEGRNPDKVFRQAREPLPEDQGPGELHKIFGAAGEARGSPRQAEGTQKGSREALQEETKTNLLDGRQAASERRPRQEEQP